MNKNMNKVKNIFKRIWVDTAENFNYPERTVPAYTRYIHKQGLDLGKWMGSYTWSTYMGEKLFCCEPNEEIGERDELPDDGVEYNTNDIIAKNGYNEHLDIKFGIICKYAGAFGVLYVLYKTMMY